MSIGRGHKFRDCQRVLMRNGWVVCKRTSTSHVKFEKNGKTVVISSGSQGVNKMLWRRLCKENNIKEEA